MTMTSNEARECANELLVHAGISSRDLDATAVERVRNGLWELFERTEHPNDTLALARLQLSELRPLPHAVRAEDDYLLDLRQAWLQVVLYVERGMRAAEVAA